MEKLKIGYLPVVLGIYIEMVQGLEGRAQDRVIDPVKKRLEKYGDVIYTGIISSIEKGRKARSEILKNDVDIIVIQTLSYTASEVPFSVLRGLNKPLVVLNSQFREKIGDGFKLDNVAEEHCLVGSTELTSLLKRIEYPKYYIISGLMDKDSTFKKIDPILKAVQVKKLLEGSNVGYIGSTVYTGMMDIEADETMIKAKLGPNIIHLRNTEIADAIKKVSKKEVDDKKAQLSKKYNTKDIDDASFIPSLKSLIAYRKLIDKYELSAIANYCQATMYDPDIGHPPCITTSVLTAEGIPFSCEGDLGNAISMLIMNFLTGGAAFAETYMLDYDKNTVLLGHCGQGNMAYAKDSRDVCIRPHPAFQDSPEKGASSNFSYMEGDATLFNISTDSGCRFKMVISTGKLLGYKPVDLGVPQGWYDPGMELDTFVEKWLAAGPTHHAALGYGDVSEILVIAGDLLDMNVYSIKGKE